MKNKIGIVQGRLSKKVGNIIQSFPKNSWESEFKIAKEIGLNGIELIYDNRKNPFLKKNYIKKISSLSKQYNIDLVSLSCDYSMHYPLYSKDRFKTLKLIKKLIEVCIILKIPRIGLSFEDNSSITNNDQLILAVKSLKSIMEYVKNKKIIVTLETNLNPLNVIKLIKLVGSPKLKINFDLGNASANGEDSSESILKLKNYIFSIHIKDRSLLFGKTVKLGKGDVNFKSCFKSLKKIKFSEYIILQGARGSNDIRTAKNYIKKIKEIMNNI